MKATKLFVVLSLSSVFAAANAQDHGSTREQVRNDLEAAQQSGEVYYGASGMMLREVFPDRYSSNAPEASKASKASPEAQVEGKSREQVRAELVAAEQSGDIVTSFAGRTERELFAARYPAQEGAPNRAYAAQ